VVLQRIAAGGMGVVYAARDPALGRTVALKVVPMDLDASSSPEGRDRVLREAQAIAHLSHPNVIAVHDVGTVGQAVFLALEVVEGGTLREWLRIPGRPWRSIVDVVCAAGEGLAAVHAAGLVHRDFKPENVLVGKDGRVRVTDFGLARWVGGPRSGSEAAHLAAAPSTAAPAIGPQSPPEIASHTSGFVGTPAYAAPEQWAHGIADARSDLFSFCVALYEALYGARPFAGDTLAELSEATSRGVIAGPPSRSRVPDWLRRIVVRGLHPQPPERPRTMRLLLDEIKGRLARRRARVMRTVAGLAVASVVAALATFNAIRAHDRTTLTSQARQVYENGLRRLRDGDRPASAAKNFARALALDPAFAQAHLRYALGEFWEYQVDAREHLARAAEGRHTLGEKDRLLLTAAEALMQTEPADTAAYARLLDDGVRRHPDDLELMYAAAAAHYNNGDRAGAIAFADRGLDIDPGFGGMYYLKSAALADAADTVAALTTIDACAVHARNPIRCLSEQNEISAAEGNCGRLEQTSRQILLRDPSDNFPYLCIARAAYASGQPIEAVRDLLKQHVARCPPPVQPRVDLEHLWALDVLAGDFETAMRRLDELERILAAQPDQTPHALLALRYSSLLMEEWALADAARVAEEFRRRKLAWIPDPRRDDMAVSRDPTVRLLLPERRAGLISPDDFRRQRQAWVDSWKKKATMDNLSFVWLFGYAAATETPDDARDALAARPAHSPLRHSIIADTSVGTTYLLASQPSEALPYLRRAAHSCSAIDYPLEHTRVHLALGQALEAVHQPREACEAYAIVLARWGNARPRSITAERARRFAKDLGCRPPAPLGASERSSRGAGPHP
jgi:serine/threonine-protein kinase